MPPFDTFPTIKDAGQNRWQNWHQTVDRTLAHWLAVWNADPDRSSLMGYNETTKVLQRLLQHALDADLPIRAHGGMWSFSGIAATNGILLNTQPLNYRFPIGPDQVHPDNTSGLPLFFVQCGMSVADLNHYLAAKQFALRTCGASNGQTIAGAVSTGTHGSAFKIGAMQDCVRALHLITAPDRSVWLERESRPAVKDSLAGFVGAELIRNDELFNAALVSFGSFGLIHGVLLEVEPMYFLQIWRQELKMEQKVWDAIESLNFGPLGLTGADNREPDHFQVVMNPFDDQSMGIITYMFRVNTPPAGSKPPTAGSQWSQGDSALEAIGLITDLFPDLTGTIANALSKIAASKVENVCGHPGSVFRDTTTRGKAAGAGIGVPLNRARETIEIARKHARAIGAPALLAVRLVKATSATLGFTRFEKATAVIDLDCPQSAGQARFFRAVWQELDQLNIPFTFHWGKVNDIDRARMFRMYGDRVQRWREARRTLLKTDELRRTFANEFTDRAGLSD